MNRHLSKFPAGTQNTTGPADHGGCRLAEQAPGHLLRESAMAKKTKNYRGIRPKAQGMTPDDLRGWNNEIMARAAELAAICREMQNRDVPTVAPPPAAYYNSLKHLDTLVRLTRQRLQRAIDQKARADAKKEFLDK